MEQLTLFGAGDHDGEVSPDADVSWDQIAILGARAVYLMVAFTPFVMFGPPLLTLGTLLSR